MEKKLFIDLENKFAGELPKYGSEEAAGADIKVKSILKVFNGTREIEEEKLKKIRKDFDERGFIKMRKFERILFGTDLVVNEIPTGYEIQVRPRSGLALKRGLTVLNSPGTIDSDYRGEIGIILYNSTPYLNEVKKEERVAQLVVSRVNNLPFRFCIGKKSKTKRGEGGFGSTGTL